MSDVEWDRPPGLSLPAKSDIVLAKDRARSVGETGQEACLTRILIVRLGAMGDIIHTLPAAAALKAGHPGSRVTWVVEPQWAALLESNPFVDRIVAFRRERFFE